MPTRIQNEKIYSYIRLQKLKKKQNLYFLQNTKNLHTSKEYKRKYTYSYKNTNPNLHIPTTIQTQNLHIPTRMQNENI